MGQYKCPLKDKLKPSRHNEWHPDIASNVCPVLREEMQKALDNENWGRLGALMDMLDVFGEGE